jgi:cAMP-dependent protein kinase regulator
MDPSELEGVPLFDGLDKKERKRVAQAADLIDVPEGKRLAIEGDLAYEFFVIQGGTAGVDVGGEARDDMECGDFFGEIGVLDAEHVRTATVTAKTPMKLIVITGHEFRTLRRDMPEVAEKVERAMRERTATTGPS